MRTDEVLKLLVTSTPFGKHTILDQVNTSEDILKIDDPFLIFRIMKKTEVHPLWQIYTIFNLLLNIDSKDNLPISNQVYTKCVKWGVGHYDMSRQIIQYIVSRIDADFPIRCFPSQGAHQSNWDQVNSPNLFKTTNYILMRREDKRNEHDLDEIIIEMLWTLFYEPFGYDCVRHVLEMLTGFWEQNIDDLFVKQLLTGKTNMLLALGDNYYRVIANFEEFIAAYLKIDIGKYQTFREYVYCTHKDYPGVKFMYYGLKRVVNGEVVADVRDKDRTFNDTLYYELPFTEISLIVERL